MGTASRSVEIGDRASRSLCGHRRRQWPRRPAVPPPQGGKGPFPDGNQLVQPFCQDRSRCFGKFLYARHPAFNSHYVLPIHFKILVDGFIPVSHEGRNLEHDFAKEFMAGKNGIPRESVLWLRP